MKVQYLAKIASISLLSFGVIAGCGNPCAAKTSSNTATENTATEVSADPCAGVKPCAGADPCAGVKPCAGANACAGANPCASKMKSVGGPLAQELQGKPVVVDVYATWCSACKNIAPTLTQLKQDYDGEVNFVVLDVSDQSTTAEAKTKAEQLGLSEFLEVHKTKTGTVTVIDPATGDIIAQYKNKRKIW
ncbi:MAG: thioredoxin domain-containing protein [Cyanobacteriota bacterium]|nr:thioredoxin domain-containing protein [Cyanobacteriota bacterium]